MSDRYKNLLLLEKLKAIHATYLDEYATIVTNVANYMRMDHIFDQKVLVNAIDYYMYLFNTADMKYSTGKITEPLVEVIYIGAGSENPEEILSFIECLYSEKDNYNLFMYGEEGIDYEINNGRISFSEKRGRAHWGEIQFYPFKNYIFESMRGFHPQNWEEVLEKISGVPEQTKISLYDYVLENSNISKAEQENMYNKHINFSRDEKFALDSITSSFLSDILEFNESPQTVLDEYIRVVLNIPEVQVMKNGYYRYIDELFKYVEDKKIISPDEAVRILSEKLSLSYGNMGYSGVEDETGYYIISWTNPSKGTGAVYYLDPKKGDVLNWQRNVILNIYDENKPGSTE